MKTAMFVANTSWFLYNFRLDIMLHMQRLGFKVLAIAPHDQYTKKIEKNSIKVIDIKIDRKGKNIINDLFFVIKLRKIYKTYNPMVIHHFTIKPSIYGTIAARLTKVPRIANSITGLGHVFIEKGLTQSLVKFLYKAAFSSRKVRVIFENPDDMELFLSNNIIQKKQAFLIFGNGVDSESFAIENPEIKTPTDFYKENKEIIFSLFARMIWNKGIREFVDAARIVNEHKKNIKFYLFGSVDEGNPASVSRDWLTQVAKESFIFWFDQVEDVKPYMKFTDVVVLPSAYKEGVPQALIEAASMSKPIITTNVSGCREIVKNNKNGLIVPPNDSKSLAEAMIKLAEDKDLREMMGKFGRKLMLEKFDARIVIEKTKEVYFS